MMRYQCSRLIAIIFFSLICTLARAQIFGSADTVTYRQFLVELEKVVETLEDSPILQAEFAELAQRYGVADTPEMYAEFVRVRTAFEATRDSGLWQVRWAVTDREPNSDYIWQQWRMDNALIFTEEKSATPTAVAECDELSALFAIIARALGVQEVGLFWPTHNHTVAVWSAKSQSGETVRIVVPTSQIYLSQTASLGTTEFDPSQQKTIHNYTRRDIQLDEIIPAPMAEMMITQIKIFGSQSSEALQNRRNRLSKQFGGS